MKDAKVCSRRALVAVLCAGIWVLASVLGPRLLALAPKNWILIGASTIAYGGLTIGVMAALVWQSSSVAFDRYTRRVVRARLLPFPLLLVLAVLVGAATWWSLSTEVLGATWCAIEAFLCVLLVGVGLARIRELRTLRRELNAVVAEEALAIGQQPSWPGSLHNWPTLPQIR